jgi:hypothetical protein
MLILVKINSRLGYCRLKINDEKPKKTTVLVEFIAKVVFV